MCSISSSVTNKTELFKKVKINLAKCFFLPDQKHIFNSKRLLSIFLAIIILVSFLIFEANSVIEYVRSAYLSITVIATFTNFLSYVFKTDEMFILIDTHLTETIKKSELIQFFSIFAKMMIELIFFRIKMPSIKTNVHCYIETHRLVEKCSKIITFVIVHFSSMGPYCPKP